MDINSIYIQKQIDETTMWQPVDDIIKYNIKCEKILDSDKYKFDLYIDYRNQFETTVTNIKSIDCINNKNRDKIKLFISDNTNYLKIIYDGIYIIILNKKQIIFEPETLIKYCSFHYVFLINGNPVLPYFTRDCGYYGKHIRKHIRCYKCKEFHTNCKKCINNIHCEINEPDFMDYIMENKKVIDDFNEFFIHHKNKNTILNGDGTNISYADNTANLKNYMFLYFIVQYGWYKIYVLYLNYLNSKYNIRYITSCPILARDKPWNYNYYIPSFQITITNDAVPVFKEYKYVCCEQVEKHLIMHSLNSMYYDINNTNNNLEIICVLSPLYNNQNIIIYRQDINI